MSYMNINQAAMNQLLYRAGGPVHRKITSDTRRLQAYAREYAPVDKGPLRSSITADVASFPAGNRVTGTVGSPLPYAIWQESGTGIYGPRGGMIKSPTGRLLKFKPKGSPHVISKYEVRGVRPTRFLTRALALVAASGGYSIRRGRRTT